MKDYAEYFAFDFGSRFIDAKKLMSIPGVEVHRIDGSKSKPDLSNQINMILLEDMHCPAVIAFVGGEQAKRLAKGYNCTWIADTPAVNDELLAFWKLTNPSSDAPSAPFDDDVDRPVEGSYSESDKEDCSDL